MENKPLEVAVGIDRSGWHEKFADALEGRKASTPGLSVHLAKLDRTDWIRQIGEARLVIWKPPYMGPFFSGCVKEKIYFMEKFLGLTVVPDFATVWHFESKAAQTYLFDHLGVPTPRTMVSFDYDEAIELGRSVPLPIVAKRPYGAGSVNVDLVTSRRRLSFMIQKEFCLALWNRAGAGKLRRAVSGLGKPWFWEFLRRRARREEQFGMIYLQEFVRDNPADLRITAIGDRFASGFWRNNRPGDFRASGSGRIDYEKPIPEDALRLCLDINRRLGFDSMAYDILFRDGKMLVSEMSYGYSDVALHRVAGYWVLEPGGIFRFVEGNTWPQELWVEWALIKAEAGLHMS